MTRLKRLTDSWKYHQKLYPLPCTLRRIYDQQRTPDSADEGAGREDGTTTGQPRGDGGSEADISEMHAAGGQTAGPRNRTRSSSIQLGVMKSGSQAREYDLIPGIVVGHIFMMRVHPNLAILQ